MSTLTVPAGSANTETLAILEKFAQSLPEGVVRDAVAAIPEALNAGRDIILAGADETVTPSQAAMILGVSRPHLYKVLDSGALAFKVVGTRDRRIVMSDLRDYVTRTESLRQEIARKTAHSRKMRAAALDEM